MMNENSRNVQTKTFFYNNRENIILITLILFTVLSLIYMVYEINYNKLAILNISDKNKISVTEDDKNFYNSVNNSPKSDVPDQPAQSIGTPLFILGEKDGKMALYSGDKSEELKIYDVYINTLPDYDRKELEAGIAVYDPNDLDSLIEDFTS